MAISTGIFKTPTGPVYDPARDIERGFDKTAGIITGALERKAKDVDMQQAAFSEMYANLGELEAKLQENYSGIQQQMIDSTREWLKEANKSGKRATDPEFQMGLSQRVGRIRAGMANADRNREQLKQAAELIKSDPSILDKGKAFSDLYLKMNDPDFLISKNGFNSSEFLDNYVNPTMVAQKVAGMIKSTGTFSDRFVDPKTGQLVKETVNLNEAIDATSPLIRNEDGTTRLNIKPSDKLVTELVSGNFGTQASRFINKIATERYGGVDPETLKKAAADFLSAGMGPSYARETLMSKEERERQQAADKLQVDRLNLAYSRELRQAGKEEEADEYDEDFKTLYSQLAQGVTTGDRTFLTNYEGMSPNATGFDWAKESDVIKEDEGIDKFSSWKSMSFQDRKGLIKKYTGETVDSGWFGDKTKDKEYYDKVINAIDNQYNQTSGVKYQVNQGTKENPNMKTFVLPISDQTSMLAALNQLENLRRSGKSFKRIALKEDNTPAKQESTRKAPR